MMAEVNMSDAFLVSYHSIENKAEKLSEALSSFYWHLLHQFIFALQTKNKTKNRLQIFKFGAPVQASTQFDVGSNTELK
jgi:hypothetical protein